MFFVKHASKSKLVASIQPLTYADFIVKINDDGLSYIEDFHQVQPFKNINGDIFKLSYATYILALADAPCRTRFMTQLFCILVKTLDLMESGLDYEVLTNIFEIQLLGRFGVSLNFHECVFVIGLVCLLIIPTSIAGSCVRNTIRKMAGGPIWIPMFPICLINFRLFPLMSWKPFPSSLR